jgi:hypothetical protein
MSAMSKLSGWVAARCVTLSESSAVISSVKPRSSFTFCATSLRLDTPVPNWRSVTSLMFCAQIIGNPVTARNRLRRRRCRGALEDGAPADAFLFLFDRHWGCSFSLPVTGRRRDAAAGCGLGRKLVGVLRLPARKTDWPISTGLAKKALSPTLTVSSPASAAIDRDVDASCPDTRRRVRRRRATGLFRLAREADAVGAHGDLAGICARGYCGRR